MSNQPPPNESLAELASVLGEDNVRTLVRTFLRDFPHSLREMGNSDRQNQHRLAHSMKSNARLMGANDLSQRFAEIEERLGTPIGLKVSTKEIVEISAQFEGIAAPLRSFVQT